MFVVRHPERRYFPLCDSKSSHGVKGVVSAVSSRIRRRHDMHNCWVRNGLIESMMSSSCIVVGHSCTRTSKDFYLREELRRTEFYHLNEVARAKFPGISFTLWDQNADNSHCSVDFPYKFVRGYKIVNVRRKPAWSLPKGSDGQFGAAWKPLTFTTEQNEKPNVLTMWTIVVCSSRSTACHCENQLKYLCVKTWHHTLAWTATSCFGRQILWCINFER